MKMGTPHYWDSAGRFFHRPQIQGRVSTHIQKRIKYMMGYPDIVASMKDVSLHRNNSVLLGLDQYGLGSERRREDYLRFAEIDLVNMKCGPMKWCAEGALE